jgi:hypothetical protein
VIHTLSRTGRHGRILSCALSALAAVPLTLSGADAAGWDPSRLATGIAAETIPSEIRLEAGATSTATSGYVSGATPLSHVAGPIAGTNINSVVGAGTFYASGYTGANAAIANIEAGHIWSGHETLAHTVQITGHVSSLNEVDRHATWVGMILGGRTAGANAGVYQQGMAPDAALFSGSISAQWSGARYAPGFTFFLSSFFDQYRRAFSTGMNANGRRADVINSSIGGGDPTASALETIGIDGLANLNPRTLFVNSAGNDGIGPDKVTSPGSGYNDLTVAALRFDPAYNQPSTFSSGGPNDYADPVNGQFNNSRQVIDIAAPGQQLGAAYYGGTTGGNGTTDNAGVGGTGPTGVADGPAGGAATYSRGVAGTSFASPTVAGGAALLYDAAYAEFPANPDARDARVVKAVLMNSADKTVGWNNGQIPHPNGQGGVQTGQGLDDRVGTGRMNLDAAYSQYLEGTTDVAGTSTGNLGMIDELGWDFGSVAQGVTNDYFFQDPLAGGSTLTATLSWFRDRRLNAGNTAFDDSYDDLDLELWRVVSGVPTTLISESFSAFNSSEHFSFQLPAGGMYALRVRWFGDIFDVVGDVNQESYGLAWSAFAVPEPGATALIGFGAVVLLPAVRGRISRRIA